MTRTITAAALRALIDDHDRELAVIDVRSPLARSRGHLAVSSGVPFHDLEQHVGAAVPVRTTTIVLASDPDLDHRAAAVLTGLGYTDVAVLEGGVEGWAAAGERVYTGTNVRSKTLGEWIEHELGTPTVDAETVAAWRRAGESVVVLDSRPHGEYVHHHLAGGLDTGGGAELAYRGLPAVPGPDTKIVVNCAGRTRGIVGAQSLVNTGVVNEVYSLRNGTPAWGWAGLDIEHGDGVPLDAPAEVSDDLRKWAIDTLDSAGATVIEPAGLADLLVDGTRTTYVVDVRRPEEHAAGTVAGARPVQGGQLVQATDEHLTVRRSRVVLVDTEDLVRAASTVQWLRYLHDGPVHVVVHDPARAGDRGRPPARGAPAAPEVPTVSGEELAAELAEPDPPLVLDLRSSPEYLAAHLPGSALVRREDLADAVTEGQRVVLVGGAGAPRSGATDLHAPTGGAYLPHFAARDLLDAGVPVRVLEGGPETVPVALTAEDPTVVGEIADQVGPPPFGPERDAWYRDYFDWEYSLVPDSAGDPDFDFERKRP